MKKVFFLIAVATLSIFCACEKETVEETNSIVEEVNENNSITEVDGKWSPFIRCYYVFKRGIRIGGNCFSSFNSICSVERVCFPVFIDPCWVVPCWIDIFDPWIIFDKIDPRDFLSFRDELALDIDPREAAIPFALNDRIAGLQFYQKDGLFEDNVFTVEDTLTLDVEVSKELGLQGNIVKAGKYPVIANEKNGTFNVILSVEKGFK